jgi:hypothetical protein
MTTIAAPATYEYRNVAVDPDRAELARDTYASFGWTPAADLVVSPAGHATLDLKRDRHIKNRPMVVELQRQAETALSDIDRLERSKTTKAMIVAFIIGLVGAGLLAGSVFTFIAGTWVPFALLGLFGLACWVAPYLCYRRIRGDRVAQVAPLINRDYETVYQACEQAQGLLA